MFRCRRFVSAVHSPIVFCHNDVQGGNVLLRQEASSADEKIMLIDYEFCGYNFRGHDLVGQNDLYSNIVLYIAE